MLDKPQLIFEILKGLLLMYEVALQAPKKYGAALERYNAACRVNASGSPQDDPFASQELVESWEASAATMAEEYAQHVYLGKPAPEWLTALES